MHPIGTDGRVFPVRTDDLPLLGNASHTGNGKNIGPGMTDERSHAVRNSPQSCVSVRSAVPHRSKPAWFFPFFLSSGVITTKSSKRLSYFFLVYRFHFIFLFLTIIPRDGLPTNVDRGQFCERFSKAHRPNTDHCFRILLNDRARARIERADYRLNLKKRPVYFVFWAAYRFIIIKYN